jgi:hypothetical protein
VGDNLVPNGLSRVCPSVLLQIEIFDVVHEAEEPNAVIDFLDAAAFLMLQLWPASFLMTFSSWRA